MGFLVSILSDLINPYASIKDGFALNNGGKTYVGERQIVFTKLRVASSCLQLRAEARWQQWRLGRLYGLKWEEPFL